MMPLYIIFIIISTAIALYDFLYFKIPNTTLVLLLGIFLIKWGFIDPSPLSYYPFLIFGGTFILGFCLYMLHMVGAGDAKYFAVASLWASTTDLPIFILIMSFTGGIVGCIYLNFQPFIKRLRKLTEALLKRGLGKRGFTLFFGPYTHRSLPLETPPLSSSKIMPYGIAISGGSIVSILMHLMR